MITLLQGIRVLDLTTILSGPYATRFLGDLGAEVIKVEPPGGDLLRQADGGRSRGMGAAYLNCNRNKRSIVIDLKHAACGEILYRLARTADVFVHNMRPKSAQKLGIGYDELRRIKADIVYCYACGFGQGGRMQDNPAYDDIVQAVSGLAFLNAQSREEPRYLPNVICDKIAGLHLAIGILAGVLSRNRTGDSVCIEAPMFESMVSFLFVELLGGRTFDPPLGGIGYHRLNSPFRKPFRTRDGFLSILPYSTGQWQRFLRLVGRAELAEDESVCDSTQRSQNIDSLYRLIADVAPGRTTAEWHKALAELDIPCADVNTPEDLLRNPHLLDVGLFQALDHPSEGRLQSVRAPLRVTGATTEADHPAPGLGTNGAQILREAGFTEAEIAGTVETGAVQLFES